MADSKYPNQIDTDEELPRVDANIVEIGPEAINGLRSAVFAIEETLGTNPEGTAADLATRLSASLNNDGTLKASALNSAGLASLPIDNDQVGANAGIEESKLDLDYSTVFLKTSIDELDVFTQQINNTLIVDVARLAAHIAHPGTYGRHQTQDIDGYVGNFAGYNLQGIVNDLDTRIIDHLADPVDAHDASAISVDDTDLSFTATDAQTAIEGLNEVQLAEIIKHRDELHSNGVLKSQEVFVGSTKHSSVVVSSASFNSLAAGTRSFQYSSVPGAISSVRRYDRVELVISGTTYIRFVKNINTSTGVVEVFKSIPVSGSGTAIIYQDSTETAAQSQLKLALRQPNISSTGGSVVQLIHPSAPFILSAGVDPRALSASSANIKLTWATGNTGDIDVYTAMQTYPVASSPPSSWTVENLAVALNETFRSHSPDNHFPLIAFTHNGELGIAFDEPSGTLSASAPSSDSAWSVLGFTGTESVESLGPRRFYIDGYQFSGVREIIDSTGETVGLNGVTSIISDLVAAGITASGLVRVKNSSDDGTYVFDAVTTDTLTINEHPAFSTDSSVRVQIYGDYFSVPTTPTNRTLFELFVDGYENENVELKGIERVEYSNTAGTPNNPETWFDIVDVSRSFEAAEKRIRFEETSGVRTVALGNRSTGLTITSSGETVTLPTSTPEGYRFRLYDGDGINYLELVVVSSAYASITSDNAIDVEVFDRVSEERFLQIGSVLHDKTRFSNLSDRRLLGTVGRKDIREDYTRDFVSYPRSLIRGNGVIRGCGVSDSSGDVQVAGGEVSVNGKIFSVAATLLTVPTDGATSTYNVFIDSNGAVRMLKDDQHITGQISAPTVGEIISSVDKTILAQVEVNSSNTITAVNDFRRFVNNLDNKVDLIVEENDITHGSFASFAAASNYISASFLAGLTVQTTIKVRGGITIDSAITLASNIVIQGEGPGNGQLLFESGGSITIGDGTVIKDLGFVSESTNSGGMLRGTAISDTIIQNCAFDFLSSNDSNAAIVFSTSATNCIIKDCSFELVGTGISIAGPNNAVVENNMFDEVTIKAIELTDPFETFVCKNVIESSSISSSTTPYMIDLVRAENCAVYDNVVKITDNTTSETGAAIRMNETSTRTTIRGNKLVNGSTSARGLLRGIWLDGTGGTTAGDHVQDIVAENQLLQFFSSSAVGIDVNNAGNLLIQGNKVLSCGLALRIDDSQHSMVHNNRFETDSTLTGIRTVFITATSPFSDGQFLIFTNNIVSNEASSTSARLFENTGTGGYNNISHNTFIHSTSVSSSNSFLALGSDSSDGPFHCDNNILIGGTYSGNLFNFVSGAGNGSTINFNDLSAITSYSSVAAASSAVRFMNIEEEYSTLIPLSHASRRLATTVWDVDTGSLGSTRKITLAAGSGGSNAEDYLLIDFSLSDLIGMASGLAKITKVEVRCKATTGTDLDLSLVESAFTSNATTGTLHVSATNPAGGGSLETVTLTPSTAYIGNSDVFSVLAQSTAGTGNQIYGVLVYWKLAVS